MDIIPALVAGLLAFIVVGVVLSRQSSRRKKEAIASLEAEREAMHHYSILELVDEEVDDLGLRGIPGAEGLSADVLLRVWKDAPHGASACDRAQLRYVVAPGVAADDAGLADVRLECPVEDHGSVQSADDRDPSSLQSEDATG
jgi:hypothetical protein